MAAGDEAAKSRPIRVIHVYSQHRGGGGAENATHASIDLLRRYGIEVEAFTRNSKDLPQNILGRLQAGTSALYAGESVRRFKRLLDSYQPDVVHVHDVFPLISPWIIPVCTKRNIPVVMALEDYRLTCPIVTHFRDDQVCTRCLDGKEYWAVLKNCRKNLAESITVALYTAFLRRLGLLQRNVACFVAPSDFTREWLIQHAGVDAAKFVTIPPVVDIPETAADPVAGTYIAFGGRFVPEKGIATLQEAARLTGLPFRLSRNELYFVNVDLPPSCDVVVTRGRKDLDDFYRGARMLVFPSIWFETFGLVGAEAMSHGIPVIASRIGSLAGLVEDGVDGLLFEPGDPYDLAEKVKMLWNDPELCRRLGHAARKKAATLWNPTNHYERLKLLYEDLRVNR